MFEKNNKIWDTVRNSIKKEYDSKPVCNELYLKTEIKFCESKIKALISNNNLFLFQNGQKIFTQMFFEECRYTVKQKKKDN